MKGELAFFDRRGAPTFDNDLDDVEETDAPSDRDGFANRPNVTVLIEAISNAASSLASKDETIRDLEVRLEDFAGLFDRMKDKLNELMQMQQSTTAFAKAETQRANKAEASIEALKVRAQNLEEDLDAALMDLQRVADVIAASNFLPRH